MKRYNAKDPSLLKKIEESICMNAIEIINLCSSLDTEYLVIEGPVLKFGKFYIDLLIKKVLEYSKNKIRTKIVPSSLEENSTILGTAYQGVTAYFLKTLEDLTKKRIKKEDFKINKAFYEI